MRKKLVDLVLFVAVISTITSQINKLNVKKQEAEEFSVLNNMNSITNTVVMDDTLENKLNTLRNLDSESLEYKLHMDLYNSTIDYLSIIEKYENGEKVDEKIYLKSLYMLIYNSGKDMNEILNELHTMLVMHQRSNCVDIDVWNEMYHELISLYDTKSLVSMYLNLAIYAHIYECDQKHEINQEGIFTCDNLKIESNELYDDNTTNLGR